MGAGREKHEVVAEQPRNRISLNPIIRLFQDPKRHVEPYVSKGQVAADLGCHSGYYTLSG
jgi:hypothetical protein